MRRVGMFLAAGLLSLPVMAMHPSWDANGDGINDCESDGSCDHTVDYTQPRPAGDTLSPSFSCSGEHLSSVEQLICTDSELARLDVQLQHEYQALLAQTDDEALTSHLRALQRGWIKGRDECWKSSPVGACVAREYRLRLSAVQELAGQISQSRRVVTVCEPLPEHEMVIHFYPTQPPIATLTWRGKASLLYRDDSASATIYRGAGTQLRQQDSEFIIDGLEEETSLSCQPLEAWEK